MTTSTTTPNPSLTVLGKKIVFSTAVQYAGRGLQMLLAVVALKLISNFLSQHDYGIYGTITEYSLFFSVVANLGIFANIVRRMADNPRDGRIFISGLALRLISAGIIFIIGIFYLLLSGSDPLFIGCVALLLVSLFLDFITSVCDGMLQANYLMGRATLALVAGRLVSLAGIFLLTVQTAALTGMGAPADTASLPPILAAAGAPSALFWIFGASIAGSLVTALLSLYFVRARIDWSWKADPELIKKLFWTSFPIGLVSTVNLLYFRFLPDYFATLSLTEEQFATFNISFRIAQVVSLLSTFLMFSALPGLREYLAQKHWQKVLKLLRKIWIFLAACGLALVVFGSLFGAPLIELLTHKKYFLPEFWFVLPLMFVLAAVSYGYDVILVVLFALEKDWWLFKRELLALTIALLFFGAGWLIPAALPSSVQLKLLLIIIGAIAGETTMLILGAIKIKKSLGLLTHEKK